MEAFTRVGLDALLTPDNCLLVLIDHQPFQLANVHSHEPTMVINNVTALAKTAKAYGIPTILTTVNGERGGKIFSQVQAVFPDQKPIDRTFINAWEDRRVVEAAKRTGRNKLVIAALWSEMCLAMPAIQAQRDWARTAKLEQITQILLDHAGATAASLAWESQLLQANEVTRRVSS
jgi:nicotinamidase-related amidase